MEAQTATRKVAFAFLAVMLTLVSTLVLSQQPAAALPKIPEGVAITVTGKTFFVIKSNYIYTIADTETLDTCFGGAAKATKIYGPNLFVATQSLKNGGKIGCPVSYPEGKLIKSTSQSTAHILLSSRLYVVQDSATLNECLGGSNNVQTLSDVVFGWANIAYPVAGNYYCPKKTYAEASLLQASGPDIYLIKGGKRLAIPDPTVLACFGNWPKVTRITDPSFSSMIANYPDGGTASCPYSLANGSKLHAPSGAVYILLNGRSYVMPSEAVLNQCYGGWANVRWADQAEINSLLSTYPDAGAAPCAVAQISPREQNALNWAIAEANSPKPYWSDRNNICWSGYCELFVENAFGRSGQFSSAYTHYQWQAGNGRIHADSSPPKGALVFYSAWGRDPYGNSVNYGHIGISLGDGRVVATVGWGGQCLNVAINNLDYFSGYLGWAIAPDNW